MGGGGSSQFQRQRQPGEGLPPRPPPTDAARAVAFPKGSSAGCSRGSVQTESEGRNSSKGGGVEERRRPEEQHLSLAPHPEAEPASLPALLARSLSFRDEVPMLGAVSLPALRKRPAQGGTDSSPGCPPPRDQNDHMRPSCPTAHKRTRRNHACWLWCWCHRRCS